MRATSLGRDPMTGCIVADEKWWKDQNDAMLGCICFRDAPLEHEEQMRIIFEAVSVTNETSFVPLNGEDGGGQSNSELEREGQVPTPPNVTPTLGKRPTPLSPKGKKKKTFRDQCMKRLVDAYEKKAESSNNLATSNVVDSVSEEIGNMLDQVIKDGAEEGSDEHYYATQLLIKKEYSDVFITLKTSNGRLNWLRRAWEDSKKR
ncbi:hypothetical protein GQ55_9G093100 [Panicum hallii var. hallii]|uniref:Myb/SANT-like domain-containing protein n=1 Tax=Panicum hallii var. hallii TaxID=1504633 RepID=A0A2T7C1A3_9POAL|nr:hypothetical protein GQ55_9G093100 [Panicum hallii var. hallii]